MQQSLPLFYRQLLASIYSYKLKDLYVSVIVIALLLVSHSLAFIHRKTLDIQKSSYQTTVLLAPLSISYISDQAGCLSFHISSPLLKKIIVVFVISLLGFRYLCICFLVACVCLGISHLCINVCCSSQAFL
jgi:hypothetical protein